MVEELLKLSLEELEELNAQLTKELLPYHPLLMAMMG